MELIDHRELLDLYNYSAIEELGEYGLGCFEIIHDLLFAPVVDAVKVVRCKDCRFLIDRHDGTYGCYRHFIEECELDDYCSYGEEYEKD